MGSVQWLYWATNCGHIGRLVAIGPSYLVENCRRSRGTVLATGLIILIVHPFVGGRLC
jgi:hypothetical protein